MAKKKRGRRGLSGVSIETLQAEISRRRAGLGALERKRKTLLSRLAKVEAKIVAHGGTADRAAGVRVGRRGARRRAQNDMSLAASLKKVLTGKTMGVSEVAEAVQRAGYKTTSPNFRTIVNQTLIKGNGFRKVKRGKYTAR